MYLKIISTRRSVIENKVDNIKMCTSLFLPIKALNNVRVLSKRGKMFITKVFPNFFYKIRKTHIQERQQMYFMGFAMKLRKMFGKKRKVNEISGAKT